MYSEVQDVIKMMYSEVRCLRIYVLFVVLSGVQGVNGFVFSHVCTKASTGMPYKSCSFSHVLKNTWRRRIYVLLRMYSGVQKL